MYKHTTPFTRCPDCGHLIRDPGMDLVIGETPCPDCRATSDGLRERHPTTDALNALMELVHCQRSLQLANERAVAIFFMAAAMEALLDVFLRSATERHDILSRMEANKDLECRLSLCDELVSGSLQDVLAAASLPDFMQRWRQLAAAQGRLMHGDWEAGYSFDAATIEYIRDNCFEAYAAMCEQARRTQNKHLPEPGLQ